PLAEQDRVVGEDYAHAAKASAGRAERRKPRDKAGCVELEESFGRVDAGELVVAEILELVLGAQLLARARGKQDLAAAAGLSDAPRPVDVEPEVRPVADVRLAGVDSHPHAEVDAGWPLVLGERALRRHDRAGSGPCVGERNEELVAALVDDDAVAGLDGPAEEPAVIVEDLCVPVSQPLDEL